MADGVEQQEQRRWQVCDRPAKGDCGPSATPRPANNTVFDNTPFNAAGIMVCSRQTCSVIPQEGRNDGNDFSNNQGALAESRLRVPARIASTEGA